MAPRHLGSALGLQRATRRVAESWVGAGAAPGTMGSVPGSTPGCLGALQPRVLPRHTASCCFLLAWPGHPPRGCQRGGDVTGLVAEHPVLWGGPGAMETLTCCCSHSLPSAEQLRNSKYFLPDKGDPGGEARNIRTCLGKPGSPNPGQNGRNRYRARCTGGAGCWGNHQAASPNPQPAPWAPAHGAPVLGWFPAGLLPSQGRRGAPSLPPSLPPALGSSPPVAADSSLLAACIYLWFSKHFLFLETEAPNGLLGTAFPQAPGHVPQESWHGGTRCCPHGSSPGPPGPREEALGAGDPLLSSGDPLLSSSCSELPPPETSAPWEGWGHF